MKGYKTITISENTYDLLSAFSRKLGLSRGRVVDYAIERVPIDTKEDKEMLSKELNEILDGVKFKKKMKVSDLDISEAYLDE
jgi:hypothetical protein